MDNLGLPQIVIDFLKEKSQDSGQKFKWKIMSGSNGFSQVTLQWTHSTITNKENGQNMKYYRKKTPSELRRDSERKKVFMDRKQSEIMVRESNEENQLANGSSSGGSLVAGSVPGHDKQSTTTGTLKINSSEIVLSTTPAKNVHCSTPVACNTRSKTSAMEIELPRDQFEGNEDYSLLSPEKVVSEASVDSHVSHDITPQEHDSVKSNNSSISNNSTTSTQIQPNSNDISHCDNMQSDSDEKDAKVALLDCITRFEEKLMKRFDDFTSNLSLNEKG